MKTISYNSSHIDTFVVYCYYLDLNANGIFFLLLFLSYSSSAGGEYPSSSAPIHTTPLRPTPTQAGSAGPEAPPVLKMETPRTEGAPSPSGHKKRPRPEPLFIPSTVNNKVGEKQTQSAVSSRIYTLGAVF